MARTFFNPRNTFCALWASAVESYLRTEHPNLSINEIRQLPMMQGVFQHLSDLKKGKRQAAPGADAKTAADPIDQQALMSQDFMDLAMTTMLFTNVGTTLFDLYMDFLNSYNNSHKDRDYSTEDLVGFALCTIVYVGLTGSNLSNTENEFVQYMINTLDISSENKQKIRNFWDNMTPNNEYSLQYRDASSYPNYTAIPYNIPTNGQVVMLGDWGTSMNDAKQMLKAIWRKAFQDNPSKPIVFIHLGDIYYCGLPIECDNNFNQVFLSVGSELHTELNDNRFVQNPPIFTIPGNHEYYSYGYGYFQLLDTLNRNTAGISASQIIQSCSFFCLRSADKRWQFLGMDTGQDDYNGITAALEGAGAAFEGWINSHLGNWSWLNWVEGLANNFYQDFVGPFAPALRSSELTWLQNRLRSSEFSGKTILCSHHQLFSRQAEIDHNDPQYLNVSLLKNFSDYFKNDIAAWYWGHEHTYAIYKDGIFGLNKGRLLGSSSYEATQDDDDPYANNYPMVPFDSSMSPIPIGKTGSVGLYNHAAAIFILNGSEIDVSYYQFPAWNNVDPQPSSLPLNQIHSETINSNFRFLTPTWIGNQQIDPNDVVTDHNPALVNWNEKLYLLFADGSGNISLATADVSDYRPTGKNQAPNWNTKGAFSNNGSPFTTSHSPAAVCANGVIYCFYVNSNNHIKVFSFNASGGGLTDLGSIKDTHGNSIVVGDSGLSAAFFEGVIFLTYLQSGSSNNLCWATFNPADGYSQDIGNMYDTNSNKIESEIIPALAASPNRMVMVFQQSGSSTDLQWAESTGGTWTLHSDINSLKTDGGTVTPNSTIGFSLNYYNGQWYLVYVDANDSNNYMRLCMMADETNSWKGNNKICVYKNDSGSQTYPQTSKAPTLGITAGGGFLCYRGNTHDEIYWAYF